ncbi:MAG: hemolysin family protein [Pirellulales bacterium]
MGLAELAIIGTMLLLNSVFAAYELALASIKPSRLKQLVENRVHGAAAALAMKDRMEASLAVVQLGITLVGAIAAATGGASAEESIAPYFVSQLGLSERAADILALAVLVVPLSAITIIAGELVPKVIAIRNPELVCTLLSPGMRAFAAVVFPAVWLLEMVTTVIVGLIDRVVPKTHSPDAQSGLHELRAQVGLLRAGKVIGLQQERIILQASRLSGLKVRDIMLPASDIVMVVADSPLSENLVVAHLDLHTRFPVAEEAGDPQSIIGYVNFKEMVFLAKTHPGNPTLREITRPLVSLPADLQVSQALERMLGEHVHLALVRDRGGEIVGLITQEDIFEELVGDILDEFDRLPRHVARSGRQWVVGGGAPLGRLREALGRPDLGAGLPASMSLNDWLNHGRSERLKGGDQLVLDGVWVLVRKVRRKQVTEALLDGEHGTRGAPTVGAAAAPSAGARN